MCFSQPKMQAPPPPPPPPPPPTATAERVEPARAMASTAAKRRTGTRKLTATRRPSLGMQAGQSGVQLPS